MVDSECHITETKRYLLSEVNPAVTDFVKLAAFVVAELVDFRFVAHHFVVVDRSYIKGLSDYSHLSYEHFVVFGYIWVTLYIKEDLGAQTVVELLDLVVLGDVPEY